MWGTSQQEAKETGSLELDQERTELWMTEMFDLEDKVLKIPWQIHHIVQRGGTC